MNRKDYTGLRSLRGIGAILIFYHHFGFEGPVTRSFGDFGVSLFFMLSGLVLAMSCQDAVIECNGRQIGLFLRKRVIKIYPVYLLSLMAAIKVRGCNLEFLPFDLLLLQSWIPVEAIYFSGNSVSWFVSSLFFSYLLFLPLKKMMDGRPGRFMGLFMVGIAIYFIIAATVPERFVTGIIYIFPVMELPVFILGMLVWYFMRNYLPKERCSDAKMTLIQLVVILLAVGFILCYCFVDPRWSLSSYWWIPDIIILAVLLASEDHQTPVNSILRSRALRVTGDISFVFYLFHTVVISIYRRFIAYTGFDIPLFPSSLLCLAVTFMVACLLHYYLELPLARFLKRKL